MITKCDIGTDNLNKEIIEWGYQTLLSHGYTLKSNQSESGQNTPWSYVVRFETSNGYIYLKHTPKLLALEPDITKILRDQFHAAVPEIIANNTELNCFLMKDAGRPLRGILKQKFDVTLLCKAIDQFTLLQLAVSDHVDIFLNMGVPDWRLDKLPDLFKQFLTRKDLLIADGLSDTEIIELEKLHPLISILCQKLSAYSIKESVVQPDFHDNNLLIDDSQNIILIDLGEITISHPFFSLINCLEQAKKHHALNNEGDVYQKLMDACLKNYMRDKKNLLAAFATAKVLWFVYGALAHERLMDACGQKNLMAFQAGKMSAWLREFIVACSNDLK